MTSGLTGQTHGDTKIVAAQFRSASWKPVSYAFESLVVMEFGYKNINLPEDEKIVLEWLVGVYVYACVYVYV